MEGWNIIMSIGLAILMICLGVAAIISVIKSKD